MAITNGYASLDDARRQAGVLSTADTADDARLEAIVTAVSRHIDNWTGRRFYQSTADETRYFTAECDERVDVGDLIDAGGGAGRNCEPEVMTQGVTRPKVELTGITVGT